MNNRSQFQSMCEYVYAVWRVRKVGNSFTLPSMKAYEKSLSKNRQFFKTLQSLQTFIRRADIEPILNFSQTVWKDLISHHSNGQTANRMDWCSLEA